MVMIKAMVDFASAAPCSSRLSVMMIDGGGGGGGGVDEC